MEFEIKQLKKCINIIVKNSLKRLEKNTLAIKLRTFKIIRAHLTI